MLISYICITFILFLWVFLISTWNRIKTYIWFDWHCNFVLQYLKENLPSNAKNVVYKCRNIYNDFELVPCSLELTFFILTNLWFTCKHDYFSDSFNFQICSKWLLIKCYFPYFQNFPPFRLNDHLCYYTECY